MEIDLRKQLAALQEKFRSWRPAVNDFGQDDKSLSVDWRVAFRRSPRVMAAIGWAALFLVSIAGGFGAKTAAENSLVIGHGDYRLLPSERLYALNELREKALDAGASLPVETKKTYPACGEDAEDPSL